MEHLRKLRTERHLSQQALALEIDTTQQSINKYETGKAEPDFRTLKLLAEFFHTSVDYLIGYTDNPVSYRLVTDAGTAENAVLPSDPAGSQQYTDPKTQILRELAPLDSSSLYATTPIERHHLMMYRKLSQSMRSSLDTFLEGCVPDDSFKTFLKQGDQ